MYLFFDTETAGLPRNRKAPISNLKNWPRLVQIAWMQYDPSGNLVNSKDFIIKPDGFTIPYNSTQIHGITTEKAIKEGVLVNRVFEEFSTAIDQADYIIAHNIDFDEKIVGAEFIRKNVPHRLFQKDRICTMKSTTEFCKIPGPYGYKWPTLAELHFAIFHTDIEETHNALVDVEVCAKSFFQLKKMGITN